MCFNAARLAEIEAAEQLADEEHIGSCYNVRTQRRAFGKRVVGDRRTQICISAQRDTKLKQSCFRLPVTRQIVELRGPDGAEQHRVAVEAGVECRFGKRESALFQSGAADEEFLRLKFESGDIGQSADNAQCRFYYFRPDAVTGKNCDFESHEVLK